jgi:hypothetical protein
VRISAGSILGAAIALSAGVQAQTVRIRLTSLTTVLVQHETRPKGRPHRGDWIEFKDLLLNRATQFGKAKGRPVAWDEGDVVYTTATNRTIRVLAIFPGIGTIRRLPVAAQRLDRGPHHRGHGRVPGRDRDGHDRPRSRLRAQHLHRERASSPRHPRRQRRRLTEEARSGSRGSGRQGANGA